MKIKELIVKNYKRFLEERKISFCDPETGKPMDMVLLVGNNGSGKSSILQAIAAVVGGAAKPHFRPSDLEYPGFSYEYIQNGRLPINIKATVCLNQGEIIATREYSQELVEQVPARQVTHQLPDESEEVEIWLDYESKSTRSTSARRLFQLKGYQYALQLGPFSSNFSSLLSRVGSIYYYHEQRTAASITATQENGNGTVPTHLDDNKIRKILADWYLFDQRSKDTSFVLREGQRNRYQALEQAFSKIFNGRSLKGPAPRMMPDKILDVNDFWFFDGQSEYELGSISAGERAILPLLIDFVNWDINNSIILIDELELHLHPPLQQALVRMLPKLGKNNQFIITTHSDDVAVMFPENQIIRL
jgi:predicted ATPase